MEEAFADKRKFCAKCHRRRKDHAPPFGKDCKLVPLSEEQRLALWREVEKELLEKQGTVEEDSDELSETNADLEATLQDLLNKEKDLLAKRAAQEEQIRMHEAQLARKKAREEIERVKARLSSLSDAMESEQAKLINLQSELVADPVVVTSVPTNGTSIATNVPAQTSAPASLPGPVTLVSPLSLPPGQPALSAASYSGPSLVPAYQSPVMSLQNATSLTGLATPTPTFASSAPAQNTIGSVTQRDGPFVIPAPPAQTLANQQLASYVDPARQVYAQAATGQYRGMASYTQAARQPGATAAQLIQDYPALAAATGGVPVIAAKPQQPEEPSQYTTGKSTAENYIFKPPVKDTDKPNFYEFMHGAIKMMRYRVQYDKQPVLEYLIYYERLANLACQYKWHSVYDLHQVLSEAVKDNRARWDDEVSTTDVHRYCKERDQVQRSEQSEHRKSRNESFRRGKGREDRSSSRSDSENRSRDPADGKGGDLCRNYNKEATGCNFGGSCQFFHRCSVCDQLGLKEFHPALWCPRKGGAGGGMASGGK